MGYQSCCSFQMKEEVGAGVLNQEPLTPLLPLSQQLWSTCQERQT